MSRLALLLAAMGGAVVSLATGAAGLFERLDLRLVDAAIAARSDPVVERTVGVVVAADDDAEGVDVPEMRAWPWDRRVHAQMLMCLREAGASAVALDLLLDAPGRSSDGDDELADAARRLGRIVVGARLDVRAPRGASGSGAGLARHSAPAPSNVRLPLSGHATLPYPQLMDAVAQAGFLDAPPDVDGKTRRVWLLIEHEGRLVPSLALATYLVHMGKRVEDLRFPAGGGLLLPRSDGSYLEVALDDDGSMLLDPAPMGSVPVRAYLDVFSRYEQAGPEGLAEYVGKPVVVGQVMSGSSDVQASAIEARIHGVFLQAAALAQLIEGRLLREPSASLRLVVLGVLCLLGALLGSRRHGLLRFVGLAVLLASVAGSTVWLLPRSGWVLPAARELTGGVLAWTIASTAMGLQARSNRQRADAMFQRLLPPTVLSALLDRDGLDWMRPQRRAGVLLLARLDRPGTERLAPEEEAELVLEALAIAERAIGAAGGTTLSLDLDRVLAVFGAPLEADAPAVQAWEAAEALHAGWRKLNAKWAVRLGGPMSSGLALHAGVLTLGLVGGERHREYAAFGTELTCAMEFLASAGTDQIVASERAKTQVGAATNAQVVGRTGSGEAIYELTPGLTAEGA